MNTVPFDFDKWMKLYQEDPEAFERERQNAISTFLDSVPEERRESLQRLQWRIDAERRRHRSAIGSMVAIQRMMFTEFSRLSKSLEVLQALLRGVPPLHSLRRKNRLSYFLSKENELE